MSKSYQQRGFLHAFGLILCLMLSASATASVNMKASDHAEPSKTIAQLSPSSNAQASYRQNHQAVVLRMVPRFYQQWQRNFNPYVAERLHTTHEFIFEPLWIVDTLYSGTLHLRLVEQVTLSDDLKVVTLTLRQGLKWSDGQPLTLDDVIFSFDYLRQHPELCQLLVMPRIAAMQRLNAQQLQITLASPQYNALERLSRVPIVPQHIWQYVTNPRDYSNSEPVGSGPMTQVVRFDEQAYRQCRNPHYWQADKLAIDCIEMPKIANNSAYYSALVSGQVDWGSAFLPDIDRNYAALSPHFRYWFPAAGTNSVVLNFASPHQEIAKALNQPLFRRALSMAIHRQLIVDIATHGQGEVNDFASGLGRPLAHWADGRTYLQHRPYLQFNPEQAIRLLDDLGYRDVNGDGWRDTPHGAPFQLQLLSPQGWDDWNNTAHLLAEQWRRVGLNVHHVLVPLNEYELRLRQGNFELALMNYAYSASPFDYWYGAFSSTRPATQGQPRVANGFHDSAIDDLLKAFLQTAQPEQQLEIAHQLQQHIASSLPSLPLYTGYAAYQYSTARFEGWWFEQNPQGLPMCWADIPERLLHFLALRPVEAKVSAI
ncbi:ABC transporter substrate-binding protein [Vibrio stylophorae]|nr:ABC transporter substrate-binding protein [Vibrio stylophorae]